MDTDGQVKAIYDYTRATLAALDRDGLMPEMVQVGNETNPELLGKLEWKGRAIDWARNARLLNAGIKAVRDAGKTSAIRPRVMLHVAQPENIEPWFDAATAAGVLDYDVIGISYYRKWSKWSEAQLGQTIARVKARYAADVLLVETAYPFTMRDADSSPNSLGPDTLTRGYPATPEGQRRYLIDLTRIVIDNGGVGLVYWEPGWVSSNCRTRWGVGSGWDNAALFDSHHKNEALPGLDFLHQDYARRAP
jgi:arabinogalactan endo-1,4-beta-galactosidase